MDKKSCKYEQFQPASGVLIQFYGDFLPLSIESSELPLCVEEICERSARYLSTKLKRSSEDDVCHITSLTLPMFGLIDPPHKQWMSPRERLTSQETAYRFFFRIRFCIGASHLNELEKLDHQTWEYFYLQLHDDFINDRFKSLYRKELPRPKRLGFVVIGYFIPSQQEASARNSEEIYSQTPLKSSEEMTSQTSPRKSEEMTVPSVTFFGLKKHLPKSERLNFKWPWPYFRLYRSVSEKVTEYGCALGKNEVNVNKFKHIFMNGILEEVGGYGSEEYCGSMLNLEEGDILVDPFISRPPGITFGTNYICSIKDINNISLQTTPNTEYEGRVQIQANGAPVTLLFKNGKMAESFVSCVDGYFRLGFDFYYSLSSQSSVEAPSLTLLNKLRAFGPMLKTEAEVDLRSHMSSEEGYSIKPTAFLIHQSPTTLNEFSIVKASDVNEPMTHTKMTYDPKSKKFFTTVKCEDGTEKDLEFENETDLHRELRKSARMIRPTKKCSLSDLFMNEDIEYYCKSNPASTTRSAEPKLYQEDSIEIDHNAIVGQGQYTQVLKGQFLNFDDDEDQDCAIKQLKPDEGRYSDHFQRGLCKLGKLQKHKIFIRLYGYMMAPPIRALMEYAVMGDLCSVMINCPQPLTFLQIMSVLEHLVHGLVAMDERKEMHGNLRCRNLLVSQITNNSLRVRIGDPGMESLYNTQPLNNSINVERLPWIAVERFERLPQVTLQSEIYSFATTCWEMLSKGAHPKPEMEPEPLIFYFRDGGRPKRPKRLDPSDGLKTIKEDLWKLMKSCWESDPAARPPLKEIQRKVYTLGDSVREQEGMIDGQECWNNMVKFLKDRHKKTLNAQFKIEKVLIQSSQLEIDETESGKLGEGHYGEVRRARYYDHSNKLGHRSATSRIVAVKTTKSFQKEQISEFVEEIKLASTLDHRNIVKVIGVCYSNGQKLVMEYVDRGSLNRYLKENLSLPILAKFCLDVAEGMKYLHSKNVLHRDLAARNVLLTRDLTAKITDFGLSRQLLADKDYYRASERKVIPIHWCSPEAIEKRYFTKKGDVWSYGVLMWEIFILGKHKPHLVSDHTHLLMSLKKGQRLQCPDGCPKSFYTIMMDLCWKLDPDERADFQMLAFKVDESSRNLEAESQGK